MQQIMIIFLDDTNYFIRMTLDQDDKMEVSKYISPNPINFKFLNPFHLNRRLVFIYFVIL